MKAVAVYHKSKHIAQRLKLDLVKHTFFKIMFNSDAIILTSLYCTNVEYPNIYQSAKKFRFYMHMSQASCIYSKYEDHFYTAFLIQFVNTRHMETAMEGISNSSSNNQKIDYKSNECIPNICMK